MKTLTNKLQKQINGLSKLTMLDGEITLKVEIECESGREFMEVSDQMLLDITCPDGFTLDDNVLLRNDREFKAYIYFTQIR